MEKGGGEWNNLRDGGEGINVYGSISCICQSWYCMCMTLGNMVGVAVNTEME